MFFSDLLRLFLEGIKELIGDFVEYFCKASMWEKLFLVFTITMVVFFLYAIIYRRKVFGETGTIKYDFGYPGFDDLKEGVIEVENDKVIFKEFAGDSIFFSIPLKQIIKVSTGRKVMSSLTYWAIGPVGGLLSERNYLFIIFHQDDKDYTVRFSTHRHSFINEKLKEEILEAKNKFL